MNIEIKDKLYKKIEEYCKLNSIDDIVSFVNKMIEKQFTIEIYGDRPGTWREQEHSIKPVQDVDVDNLLSESEIESIEMSKISHIKEDVVQNIEHYDNGVELVTMEVPKRKRRVLK